MCFPDLLRFGEASLFRFVLPKGLPPPVVEEHVGGKHVEVEACR